MSLLAHRVGLGQPGPKIVIDVREPLETEDMDVVARRESLNRPESRMLQTAREYDVAIEPAVTDRDLGKRHANLEGDPRLLGEHGHGAGRLNGGKHGIEETTNLGIPAIEMFSELVPAARVRLVAVGELATALVTPPERTRISHEPRHPRTRTFMMC